MRPTSAVLCPWARHFTPRKYWLITQEAMAPSRQYWKIVDWDVKPQHNQPTICHSQQSDQGLHRLPFSSIIRVYTIWNSQTDQGLHYLPFSVHLSQHSDRGLQYLPFSAVWSGSALFAIRSKQYYQGIHCLPFSAVWSGSAVFAILSCMIRVCTICDSF